MQFEFVVQECVSKQPSNLIYKKFDLQVYVLIRMLSSIILMISDLTGDSSLEEPPKVCTMHFWFKWVGVNGRFPAFYQCSSGGPTPVCARDKGEMIEVGTFAWLPSICNRLCNDLAMDENYHHCTVPFKVVIADGMTHAR